MDTKQLQQDSARFRDFYGIEGETLKEFLHSFRKVLAVLESQPVIETEACFFIKRVRKNLDSMKNVYGVMGENLTHILDDLDKAMLMIPQIPSESFKITPAFKLSLNHGGEYHEEYFDTEAEAFAAAAKAADDLT